MILRLVWLVAWLVALPWLLLRRLLGRTPSGTVLLVEIDGAVQEAPPEPRWWPPGRRHPFSLLALRELVDAAARDPRVGGILLVIKSMRGGFATATSIRDLIARARSRGKRVLVHLPLGGGTKEVYVASAADRVFVGPQASLAPVGVLSSTRYVRGALDRAGLVPEIHARGRYKTAAEALERTTMSEPQREQLGAVLDRMHTELIGAIAVGRGVDEARARSIVDGAPYGATEAVEAGLVDDAAYEDEIPTRLGKDGIKPSVRDAERYRRQRSSLRPRALRAAGVIAVLPVHGTIAGGGGLPFRSVSTDQRIIAAVRLLRASRVVRGVILHVDSPGGSALASDRIHHELVQLAAEKPLVACIGDVGASGGYYLAVAAHEIVAQPTSITGSIGVIGARLVVDPLLARLGIATEVLQRGAHARLLDPFLPLGPDDASVVDREVERIYRAFLEVVASGRRRRVEEIELVAQGRVWTGADAHARGLVDRLGGFEHALEAVRSRIGRGAARLRVAVARPPRKPFPPLDPPERKVDRTVARLLEAVGDALDVDPTPVILARERVLAWAPGTETIRS